MSFPIRRRGDGGGRGPSPVHFEALERRILLNADCPVVVDYVADNRGLVVLTVDQDLDETTVDEDSVRLITAGEDGLLDTGDDVVEDAEVSYDADEREIRLLADLPADTRYKVELDASEIAGTNGRNLDGEFNGFDMPSGDGSEGGDLVFYARPSSDLIARFETPLGVIEVLLFQDQTPLTVQNFLNYANDGDWDNTMFHRAVDDFVIQGGGFSNTEPDFPQIPQDDPVLNEPGISNLRGTIAMAKLGGQPNSATNQWFFNLADNSENLDNQNGGFTVFGEITDSDGLAVIDAIEALERLPFTDIQTAFTDVPLLDKAEAEANGLTADNTASVGRVSILMDIRAEPFGQLDTTGSVVIQNNAEQVTVRLYDLSQSGLLTADMVDVRFAGPNRISNIKLLDTLPDQPVGIQISGAKSIGRIVDRRDGGSDLRFIVTDAEVNKIKLDHTINGYNLNGFVLEGGLILGEDVDRDGETSDPLAIYVGSGLTNNIKIKDDATGSIVALGGLKKLDIKGDANQTDVVIGEPESGSANSRLKFDRVFDSGVSADTGIKMIEATDWRHFGGAAKFIEAPSLNKLKIKGDRSAGIEGVFQGGLNLTGADSGGDTLGRADIQDVVLLSDWSITGSTGPIKIGEELSQSTFDITGDVKKLQAREVLASEVAIGGHVNQIRTDEWADGELAFGSARNVKITGNGSENIDGDFGANLTVAGNADEKFAIRKFDIAGDMDTVETDITGDVKKFVVRGDMLDSDFMMEGDMRSMSMSLVEDSDILIEGETDKMRFLRWDGGLIRFRLISDLRTGGQGVEGTINADVFEAEVIEKLIIGNGGDLDTRIRAGVLQQLEVSGNVIDSQILQVSDLGTQFALGTVKIDGMMLNSVIHSLSSADSISIGSMNNSGVYIGATEAAFGLPDDPASQADVYQTDRFLNRFDVKGPGGDEPGMINSFLFAGHLGDAKITMPKVNNFGAQFGLAVNSIRSVDVKLEDGRMRLGRNDTTPPAIEDFQVRIGYVLPENI